MNKSKAKKKRKLKKRKRIMKNLTNFKCSKNRSLQTSKFLNKLEKRLFIETKMVQSVSNHKNNKNSSAKSKYWTDWQNGKEV